MENKEEFYIVSCHNCWCGEIAFISTKLFAEDDIDGIKNALIGEGNVDYVNVNENDIEVIGKTSNIKLDNLTEHIPGVYRCE